MGTAAKLIADDRRNVTYRPRFAKLIGNVLGAILLQQMIFWWDRNNSEAFFKFKESCKDEAYHTGDSWCEELGFNRYEFDKALDVIGTKIVKGVSKAMAMQWDLPRSADFPGDDKGFVAAMEIAFQHLVVYWTDSNRRTWYWVNSDLLDKVALQLYLGKSDLQLYLGKVHRQLYLLSGDERIDEHKESDSSSFVPQEESKSSHKEQPDKPEARDANISSALGKESDLPKENSAKERVLRRAKCFHCDHETSWAESPNLKTVYECQECRKLVQENILWPPKKAEPDPSPKTETAKKARRPKGGPWYVFRLVDGKNVYIGPAPTEVAAREFLAAGDGTITMHVPDGATVIPWPKPNRKTRPVFDAIALGSYNLVRPPQKSGRYIGTLEAGVKECQPVLISDEQLAADLAAMYLWYKRAYSTMHAPAKVETICKYLAEWRALATTEDCAPLKESHSKWTTDPTTGKTRPEVCYCEIGRGHDA